MPHNQYHSALIKIVLVVGIFASSGWGVLKPDAKTGKSQEAISDAKKSQEEFLAGDYTNALLHIEKAICNDPNTLLYHAYAADILNKLKRYSEAEVELRKSVVDESNAGKSYYINLVYLLNCQEKDSEIADIAKMIPEREELPRDTIDSIAYSLRHEGNYLMAADWYIVALKAQPDIKAKSEYCIAIGCMYLNSESIGEARAYFEKALQYDENPRALWHLYVMAIDQGDETEAFSYLDRLTEVDDAKDLFSMFRSNQMKPVFFDERYLKLLGKIATDAKISSLSILKSDVSAEQMDLRITALETYCTLWLVGKSEKKNTCCDSIHDSMLSMGFLDDDILLMAVKLLSDDGYDDTAMQFLKEIDPGIFKTHYSEVLIYMQKIRCMDVKVTSDWQGFGSKLETLLDKAHLSQAHDSN